MKDISCYYEEVDYCLKAKKNVWKVLYFPGVSIIHKNPHAFRQNDISEKVIAAIRRSHLYYYRKNQSYLSFLLLSFATIALLLLKTGYLRLSSSGNEEDRLNCQKRVIGVVWNTFRELNKGVTV